MKHPVTILIILVGHIAFGQTQTDTCITRLQLHDYKYNIYSLRDLNRVQQYQIRLLTELQEIDTLQNSKDSIILNYTSKTNVLLRTEKHFYFNSNCMTDSVVIHYNKRGLTEYIEGWHTSCDNTDTTDKDIKIFTYKKSFSRYEYDSIGRVTKYVFHISTPMTRRIIFNYDTDGKRTQTIYKIEIYEFWD